MILWIIRNTDTYLRQHSSTGTHYQHYYSQDPPKITHNRLLKKLMELKKKQTQQDRCHNTEDTEVRVGTVYGVEYGYRQKHCEYGICIIV